MTKQQLRQEIKKQIKQKSPEQRQLESKKVCWLINTSKLWQKADIVLIFLSFGTEINIDPLVELAVKENKTAAAPYCQTKGKMDFYPISGLAPEFFELNKWGIREPRNRQSPLIPDKKTLIIVPGVAFTPDGKRLGRGGGFYDRYLEKYPQPATLGIGYSCQLVKNIPTAPHDKTLNCIITP